MLNELVNELEQVSDGEVLTRQLNVEESLRELLKDQEKVLVAAGNIGLGKSTTTRLISTRLGIKRHEEKVDDYKLLKKFYDNMEEHSFRLQVDLLYRRKAELEQSNESRTHDRSIYEDPLVFAETLVESELMKK